MIKISFGCTRDFRVKMRGTSSPEDKLAGDLGTVIGATSTGGRRSDFFTAGKLAPGNKRMLIFGCCALLVVFQFDYGSTSCLMIGLPVVQSNTAKI